MRFYRNKNTWAIRVYMAPAINGRCAFEVFFFHILFRAKEKSENEIEAHIEAMLGYT